MSPYFFVWDQPFFKKFDQIRSQDLQEIGSFLSRQLRMDGNDRNRIPLGNMQDRTKIKSTTVGVNTNSIDSLPLERFREN